MLEFLSTLYKWMISHIVTSTFIVIHIVSSVILYIISQTQFLKQNLNTSAHSAFNFDVQEPWNIIADSIEVLPFTVLLAILFSGVEASVGSMKYCFQIVFTVSLVFLARQFFSPQPAGPTYIVFSPFFTFIIHHKPLYYFKIKSFAFTDSLLYILLFVQYILYDISPHLIDFVINLIALILWKIIVLVFDFCFNHGRRNHRDQERLTRNQEDPENL